jgi:ABC-type multidrug transport system fused ATPase/permease subunit
MANDTLFPSASTKDTLAFCWRQVGDQKRAIILGWVLVVLGVGTQSIAGPIIFAVLLSRVAEMPKHASFGTTFEPWVIAYGVALVSGTILWRLAGWVEWGSTLRAFGQGLTNGYDHLISLSHRWHSDRPAGEVISTLETFSWAFIDLLDTATWGFLPITVTVLGAVIVLSFFAWPVAIVIASSSPAS